MNLSNVDGFKIFGNGKIININNEVVNTDTALIQFTNCKNIDVKLEYHGVNSYDVSISSSEQYGEAALRFYNSNNIKCELNVKNCRYGVVCGNYNIKTNLCENVKATGLSYNVAFFAAMYGVDNLEVNCVCDKLHRSVYVAGCNNFFIRNVYNHQYISDVNIILTNEYKNNIMSGCANGRIWCSEANGASHDVIESKNAGVSIASRAGEMPAELKFENIEFDLDINSASGGFGVVGSTGYEDTFFKDIIVKVCTHEQTSFTVFRHISGLITKGFITIKDSDVLNYGALLLSGLYKLDNSRISASSGVTKANLILTNNSFVCGKYDALVDESSRYSYLTTLDNDVYRDGFKRILGETAYSANYIASVTEGQTVFLSEPTALTFTSSISGVATTVKGAKIKIPSNGTIAFNTDHKIYFSVENAL